MNAGNMMMRMMMVMLMMLTLHVRMNLLTRSLTLFSLGVYPLAYVWALLFIFRLDACCREKIFIFFCALEWVEGMINSKGLPVPTV